MKEELNNARNIKRKCAMAEMKKKNQQSKYGGVNGKLCIM